MDKNTGIFWLLAACAAVLLIGCLHSRAALLLRFLLRMAVGTAAISLTNGLLASAGLGVSVGLNALSLLVVGSLGIGGFGMLYAILLYMNL